MSVHFPCIYLDSLMNGAQYKNRSFVTPFDAQKGIGSSETDFTWSKFTICNCFGEAFPVCTTSASRKRGAKI